MHAGRRRAHQEAAQLPVVGHLEVEINALHREPARIEAPVANAHVIAYCWPPRGSPGGGASGMIILLRIQGASFSPRAPE